MTHPPPDIAVDGWTRVGRGRKKTPTCTHGPAPLDRDMTVDKLNLDYASRLEHWTSSAADSELCQLLDRLKPAGGWAVSTAVCVGTGSFCRDNLANRRRSVYQLVAFLRAVRHVQASSPAGMAVYAQDPLFTELDGEFLAGLGVSVIDCGEGTTAGLPSDCIGADSFVFEPFMGLGRADMEMISRANPRLYIGSTFQSRADVDSLNLASLSIKDNARTGVRRAQRRPSREKQAAKEAKGDERMDETRLVRDFIAAHDGYRFPVFSEDPYSFDGIYIHVRKHEPSGEMDGEPG